MLENILLIVIVGLIAGFLAGKVVRGRGFGCVGDVIVGMLGAWLGPKLFEMANFNVGEGLAWRIGVAFVGALVFAGILRLLARR